MELGEIKGQRKRAESRLLHKIRLGWTTRQQRELQQQRREIPQRQGTYALYGQTSSL